MSYFVNEENIRKEYEIEMDKPRLKELLSLLDKDCFVIKFDIGYTSAYIREEAEEQLKKQKNILDFNILSLYEDNGWYHGQPFTVKYEAVYKSSIGLVSIIYSLLYDRIKDKTEMYDKLLSYGNSIDFVPFDERVGLATKSLNDGGKIIKSLKAYQNIASEAILNKDYNFDRLRELYEEVLKCFKLNLVEEVITRKYTKH